jgi:hypothetical protein
MHPSAPKIGYVQIVGPVAHLLLAFCLVEVVLLDAGFYVSVEVANHWDSMSHSGWHMLVGGMADRI